MRAVQHAIIFVLASCVCALLLAQHINRVGVPADLRPHTWEY